MGLESRGFWPSIFSTILIVALSIFLFGITTENVTTMISCLRGQQENQEKVCISESEGDSPLISDKKGGYAPIKAAQDDDRMPPNGPVLKAVQAYGDRNSGMDNAVLQARHIYCAIRLEEVRII